MDARCVGRTHTASCRPLSPPNPVTVQIRIPATIQVTIQVTIQITIRVTIQVTMQVTIQITIRITIQVTIRIAIYTGDLGENQGESYKFIRFLL